MIVVIAAVIYIRTHENSSMRVFFKYIAIYITVFALCKLLPLLVFFMYTNHDGVSIESYIPTMFAYIWMSSGAIFFGARLCEPNIRNHLKDEIKILFYRSKQCLLKCSCTGSDSNSDSSSINSILAVQALENLKLEVIFIQKFEYILITISVALFENLDTFSTPEINRHLSFTGDIHKPIHGIVKYDKLEILNDISLQDKCIIYIDPKFYSEYKYYASNIFNDIVLKDGMTTHYIAK